MLSSTLLGGFVKHKVFLSYHHANDQYYYNVFLNTFSNYYDVIYDNSLVRRIDSEDVDYVMRRIRDNYVTGSSCTIVLVGAETHGRKYVDWEIKATLEKQHGLIGICLPNAKRDPISNNVIVPGRLHDNIQSGFALWLSWDEITRSALQLNKYVAEAKTRNTTLIDNSRQRCMRNG